MSKALMKDARGQPTGFRGILRDMTQRKREEEEMRRSHDTLEKRVEERTQELARINENLKLEIQERKAAQVESLRAKDTAEAANRIKSEFLANMSHELRTPLNHIIGFTELVHDQNVGDLNKQQSEYLGDVLESGKHLLSLINDILDLSKVEAGRQELSLVQIDLKSLLEQSFKVIKEKAQIHRIELKLESGEVPEKITADERKLKQVMYNLLSNAIKFTPDGGRVFLKANPVTRIVRTGHRKGDRADFMIIEDRKKGPLLPGDMKRRCLEISVSDTGIGIKTQDLERIFKPFEQADGSASRKYQGTGLGLSLTKSLVELHGGRIWAESRGEGKGSTFRFLLPTMENGDSVGHDNHE
ncbi:sensor histidine kinase [Thermodesulfobacteriota bacterium]